MRVIMSKIVADHIRNSYEVVEESENALTLNVSNLNSFLKKHNFSFEEIGGAIRIGVYIVGRVAHPVPIDNEINRLMAEVVSRPRKYAVNLLTLSSNPGPNDITKMLMPPIYEKEL
ncbi:hypothetical protein [Paenibacillus taichungensis]